MLVELQLVYNHAHEAAVFWDKGERGPDPNHDQRCPLFGKAHLL